MVEMVEKYIVYDVDTHRKYGEVEGLDAAMVFIEGLFSNMISCNLQIQQVLVEVE